MASPNQLDFDSVSQEIRSLVSRRRELLLFQGSLIAALAIYLQNVLEGKLPAPLTLLQQEAFTTYSVVMLFPTVVIALRFAKLHAGMIINGVFYAYILSQNGHPSTPPARAADWNPWGVSTQYFLLCGLIAGFEASLLMLALQFPTWVAILTGLGAITALFLLFAYFHRHARDVAFRRIDAAVVETVDLDRIRKHQSGSLEDCNHDMLVTITFVGLMLFSVSESLSSLGAIAATDAEFQAADVQGFAPIVYSLLFLATCLAGLVVYIRLAISVGRFSHLLDPEDRPFRPFRLTDSFLGYWLLAFFWTVGVHLLLYILFPWLDHWIWKIDILAFLATLAAYSLSIAIAGRKSNSPPQTPAAKVGS